MNRPDYFQYFSPEGSGYRPPSFPSRKRHAGGARLPLLHGIHKSVWSGTPPESRLADFFRLGAERVPGKNIRRGKKFGG